MPENVSPTRPPNFRQSPNERTEIYPTADYPNAAEIEDYDETPIAVHEIHDAVPPTPENKQWSTARYHVNDERIVRIGGRNPNRRRLFIRNTGSATVYVGRHQTDSINMMFPLTGNTSLHSELEMWHQFDVWAVCDSGDDTDVHVIDEFVPQELS